MSSFAISRVYRRSFQAHPHVTLAVAGGVLSALGDFVAQTSQYMLDNTYKSGRVYDFARTLRFFCFGFTISPFMGRWNLFLENRFRLRVANDPSKISMNALAKRVLCDQLVMAPLGLAVFVGSMGIMEGLDWNDTRRKYRDVYPTALLTNWKVWPVAQFINFRYMALPYRVPFQLTCGIFWTLYLSVLNSKEPEKKAKES